jgi:hypothetical protein
MGDTCIDGRRHEVSGECDFELMGATCIAGCERHDGNICVG